MPVVRFQLKARRASGQARSPADKKKGRLAMRAGPALTRKAGIVAGIAAIAMAAGASTAFAANTPDPTQLTFSITNPNIASLALASNAVSLQAAGTGANISTATATPAFTANNGNAGGGDLVTVESSDPLGYTLTLYGSAGGITPNGGGTAVNWFDMNVVKAVSSPRAGATPQFSTTEGHLTSSTQSDPTTDGAQIISTTAPSGTVTTTRDSASNNSNTVDPATGLVPDTITTAYYLQPLSGFVSGAAYTGLAQFTYVGK